jgi:hypothetical protein
MGWAVEGRDRVWGRRDLCLAHLVRAAGGWSLIMAAMLAQAVPLSEEAQVPALPYWSPYQITGIGLVIPGDGAGRGAGDGRLEVPSHSAAVGTAVSEVPSFAQGSTALALPTPALPTPVSSTPFWSRFGFAHAGFGGGFRGGGFGRGGGHH